MLISRRGRARHPTRFPSRYAVSQRPCDLNILFTLSTTYVGGPSPKIFNFNVQAGLPPIVINSTLDTTAPLSGPAFSGSTGQQMRASIATVSSAPVVLRRPFPV